MKVFEKKTLVIELTEEERDELEEELERLMNISFASLEETSLIFQRFYNEL